MDDELKEMKVELKNIQEQIIQLKNKEYHIDRKYTELLKEKCRKNIGRCFKKIQNDKVVEYCMIVDISKPEISMTSVNFNEYQYPAIWFHPSDTKDFMPFHIESLHSSAWDVGNDIIAEVNDIHYEEIIREEFMEKFKEVNNKWVNNIQNKYKKESEPNG